MSLEKKSNARESNVNVGDCQEALSAAQQENEDLRDRYLRAAAAIENARKQAERDAAVRLGQRLRNLYLHLLEVADNLERAVASSSDGGPLLSGVQATLRQLQRVLGQEGVSRIEVEAGSPFDPAIHEAVNTLVGDVDQPIVTQVLENGYLYEGQILRPARVVVAVPAGTGA